MALADIIDAIDMQTRMELDTMRKNHQQKLIELKRETEHLLEDEKLRIEKQKELKRKQLMAKAKTAGEQKKRHAVMERKQELISEAYDKLLTELKNLSQEEIKHLLTRLIASLDNATGVIRPAKIHADLIGTLIGDKAYLSLGTPIEASGGFLFEGENTERDARFESLVKDVLRPKTELSIAHTLFS